MFFCFKAVEKHKVVFLFVVSFQNRLSSPKTKVPLQGAAYAGCDNSSVIQKCLFPEQKYLMFRRDFCAGVKCAFGTAQLFCCVFFSIFIKKGLSFMPGKAVLSKKIEYSNISEKRIIIFFKKTVAIYGNRR